MIKVSVIIPVYNTEDYLQECIDSVRRQTLKEIEVICVDDGSTDKSRHILDKYAANDEKITVIHKENGGVVSARKVGEEAAKGQYIGYIDSDDWIEADMYESLYAFAEKYQADMVTSGYYLEGDYTSELFDGVEEGLYEGRAMEAFRDNAIYCMSKKDVGIRGSLCCKLFSRKLLENPVVPMPDGMKMSEDKLQVLSYILNCRSVFVWKKSYYHYRIHRHSATHVSNPFYLLSVDKVYQYFRQLYTHSNFTKTMRLQAELYITELLYKGINSRLGFLNENLLWIDPSWMERMSPGSRILLYGAGALGRKYYQHIQNHKDFEFAGCIDFGYERMDESDFQVRNPADWAKMEFDVVVITIKNPKKAEEIRRRLCETGMEPSEIYWFEQKELFWRFAEADGIR